jgi:hypothetical protein
MDSFFTKWPLALYSHQFGEASHIFLKNGLWGMSASLANPAELLGECRRVWQIFKLGHFMYKKDIFRFEMI